MEKLRFAPIIKVSTEKQKEKGESLNVQTEQIEQYVELLKGVVPENCRQYSGQEAPIVIYSMTSSSSEDAPRGMSFLYNPNRMNVATSRAKCTSILVSTPKILEVECNTIEQMKWANGVCLDQEIAIEVDTKRLTE